MSAKFERIGWGPVRNDPHDLGTDLFIQARDRRRFDRGLIVGAQVKSGPSWFEDQELDANGEPSGWWYYEPGTAHFDDWVTHGLPHLLVLHDLTKNQSYWVHVTAEAVLNTGKGCKILVPAGQTIEDEHIDALLEVAAKQKAAPPLEGTSFKASSGSFPPGRRLRYALIAPRLVAPHPNSGRRSPITAEEGVALCAQGRFLDLKEFSKEHPSVPDPGLPCKSPDWRWKFVRALWAWANDDEFDGLREVFASAPDSECRAAAGVLLACALLRLEDSPGALSILDELISQDTLAPADHGWALVQRARVRAEVGDVVGAREDAVEAQRQFRGDADDITVSALAAAAAWQLFTSAGFGAGDLAGALTAADTAVAWWRSQTVSSALDHASERAFQSWAQDTTARWSAEDLEGRNLFAAELNADLTAEHGTWRGVSGLSGRQRLMQAHVSDDHDGLVDALDALRRSGDVGSVKLALAHVYRVGPVDALREALGKIGPASWAHTTARANLEALSLAGDLAEESDADQWMDMLLETFVDGSMFAERVRPTFFVPLDVCEGVAGLLPAAGTRSRVAAAEVLSALGVPLEAVLASPLARWIPWLPHEDLPEGTLEGLRRLATTDSGQVGSSLLGWLADHDDKDAKREVHSRALAGDLHALSAMGAVTVLTAPEAATLIEKFESMVCHTVERAEKSEYGFGGFDGGRGLALLNLWFPDVARWEPLLELLMHPAVASNDKRRPLELIVELEDRLPGDVRARIKAEIGAISSAQVFPEVGARPIDALVVALAVATRALKGAAADVAVSQLALGAEQDRREAAALLGRGACEPMRPLLASFVADGRIAVRVAAARAVGRLASSGPDPVISELAMRLASDSGAVVPAALMAGLTATEGTTELAQQIAGGLVDHPSSRVRRHSMQVLRTKF